MRGLKEITALEKLKFIDALCPFAGLVVYRIRRMHKNLGHSVDTVFDSVKIIFSQGVVIFYTIH